MLSLQLSVSFFLYVIIALREAVASELLSRSSDFDTVRNAGVCYKPLRRQEWYANIFVFSYTYDLSVIGGV